MKIIVLVIAMLTAANLFAAVTAPDFDGKLFSGYDGSAAVTVWNDIGQCWMVTTLYDQVGSYNANAPSEARRPVLTQMHTGNSSHPVIDFDGGNDYLITGSYSSALAQPTTIFIVARREVTAGTYLMDGLSAGQRKVGTISSSRYAIGAGIDVLSGTSVVANQNVFEIFTVMFNTSNSWMDVTDAQGTTRVLSGNAGTSAMTGLQMGRMAGSGYLNGQIAELLIYKAALNNAEIEDVQQYLLDKYIFECPEKLEKDLNKDCVVNFSDLAFLMVNWLESGLWP